jgi:hypothetical protein
MAIVAEYGSFGLNFAENSVVNARNQYRLRGCIPRKCLFIHSVTRPFNFEFIDLTLAFNFEARVNVCSFIR